MATSTAFPSVISANQQVLLLIQTFFKKGSQNKGETITLGVKDKYEEIPFNIEINPNTTESFVLFRVITSAGEGLWQSWESPKEAENSFITMSLI